MSRVSKLHALQQIDTSRDRRLARLQKVVGALRGNEAVAAASAALASAEADLDSAERRLRLESGERDAIRDHVKREEDKLFGGAVRSPRELQNLQRETDALRRQLSAREDVLLEAMVEKDDAESRVAAARAALDAASTASEVETRELLRERAQLTAEVRELDRRRADARDKVVAPDLSVYERLRKAKHGVAVSRLNGDTCGVCGMQVPRHEADRARDGEELVSCPGCDRVLSA